MKKKIKAGDLVAKLRSDPEFVAKRDRAEVARLAAEAELHRAEAPLVEDLQNAGYKVESVWDLVNTTTPYPDALPILFEHLARVYPPRVREGIARALAVRPAKCGWELLTRGYRHERDESVRDGLAAAIAAAADDDVIDDVIALARDPQNGSSRVLLIAPLQRSASPIAEAALLELQRDPGLSKEIQTLLHRRERGRRNDKRRL